MPYIGKQPTVGNFQVCDAISVVNGQAAYTMQVGGSNVEPESANHMLVSLNGILQKPGSSFTISGSTITFASNLATGDVIDFITLLGDTLNTGVPSDDTVTAAKLNNDIISGQTALAATPDDTDELLISDAGTLKRIDFSHLKTGITVADQFRLTASLSSTADITSNLERVDTSGQGGLTGSQMSESSGIFTFPSTGIYLVQFFSVVTCASGGDNVGIQISVTTNNSSYATVARSFDRDHENGHGTCYCDSLIDVTDTSNVKVKFSSLSIDSGSSLTGNTTYNQTAMTFIRMGDT